MPPSMNAGMPGAGVSSVAQYLSANHLRWSLWPLCRYMGGGTLHVRGSAAIIVSTRTHTRAR
jgi:hypothetical protein